ncbi:Protein PHYTOCHROME KINASE SUBSTRATE 3 [Morella rubra]|uniref:Protein PHYTOCHROME KINASE SUBSTRATE 3 n=1 Tax=Morella rubra TaxID=262757 RepID=A0A6A1UG95_9ROSI|nr:Protein PHYTOCHROME KINASE SUBSTRATE 3 [Morella rubra]KAB1199349.1 Protein PHYTOCHROME KINASE SUBSTRATE 3 [Morella rubra]
MDMTDKNNTTLLSRAGEGSVLKLAKSVHPPPPAINSIRTTPPLMCIERTRTEEGEISVFGADKYFNMKLDDESPKSADDSHASKHALKKDFRDGLYWRKLKSRPGTPSLISEASPHRLPSQNTGKKVNGKIKFSGFICNRPCSDKQSLDIQKDVSHGGIHGKEIRRKATQVIPNQFQPRFRMKDELRGPSFERSNREKYSLLPISSSGVQNLTPKLQLEEEKTKEEEPRKSLDVFGSHIMKKGDIMINLERKLSILAWDAIPKAQSHSTNSGAGYMDDDMGSDASSDLFEIENLSSSEKPFTGEASDCMSSSMTPTNKYEPSEASIEWSVVTASATEISLNTGYDEKNLEETNKIPVVAKTKSKVDKEVPRSRPSGLLSCKSHKAVSVAETAYRTKDRPKLEPLQSQRLDSSVPVRRYQLEVKAKDRELP